MIRYLLDTNAASDYINRRHGVFERAKIETMNGNPIGIAVPVLAELVAGIENGRNRDRNMKSLKAALTSLRLWPFDPAAAFEYGRLYAELARIGRPIGAVDGMIAATARILGNCTVVSTDSDMVAVPGLDVENCALVATRLLLAAGDIDYAGHGAGQVRLHDWLRVIRHEL